MMSWGNEHETPGVTTSFSVGVDSPGGLGSPATARKAKKRKAKSRRNTQVVCEWF